MTTSNIAQSEENSKSEVQLSRAGWQFYDLLSGVRNLYRKEDKLQADGSFFKANDFFVRRLNVTRRWVQRLKNELQDKGLIKFEASAGRGRATYYWILDKPTQEKKSTTAPLKNNQPIDTEMVRTMVKMRGKPWVLKWQALKAYTQEEIAGCFEA